LDQIRAAVAAQVARGLVLADAGYGINTEFRNGLTELGRQYVLGVQGSMTVWEPGKQPLPAKPRRKMGRPPRLLQRTTDHQPVSVKQLAMSLPSTAFQEITWRVGTDRKLRSRFAAVRIRPAHQDYEKAEPHAEEWLLTEWPRGEPEPTKYWISTLSLNTKLKALVKIARSPESASVAAREHLTGCRRSHWVAGESCGRVRGRTQRCAKIVALSSFLGGLLQAKRLIWIELEALRRRGDQGLPSFQCRNLSPDFLRRSDGAGGGRRSFKSLRDGCRRQFGRIRRRSSRKPLRFLRPNPDEIMDRAGSRFHVAFFREYVGYLSKCSTAPPQLIDQFAIWLQARARRFLRQTLYDILKLTTHG